MTVLDINFLYCLFFRREIDILIGFLTRCCCAGKQISGFKCYIAEQMSMGYQLLQMFCTSNTLGSQKASYHKLFPKSTIMQCCLAAHKISEAESPGRCKTACDHFLPRVHSKKFQQFHQQHVFCPLHSIRRFLGKSFSRLSKLKMLGANPDFL